MAEGKKRADKKLSLAPLSFEEAMADLLKVPPPPKGEAPPGPEKDRKEKNRKRPPTKTPEST